MPILTLDLKLPSEFVKTATVGTSADWLVIQKSGESEVSKIAAVPAAVGAAPAGGDLAVNWSAAHVRSSTGYLYQQADGGSLAGSISLLNTGVADRMVFRNDAGFQFYELEGTVLAPVFAGDYSGDGYYLTGDPDTGIFSGGANILAFETGGTGCAYFDTNGHLLPGTGNTFNLGNSGNRWNYLYVNNLNTGGIRPEADSTYTIGVTDNRFSRGWFDELYVTAGAVTGSDQRIKTDIEDSDLGLDFVLALRPVRYRMATRDWVRDAEGVPDKGRALPGIRPHYGFVAQQVKTAMGARDFGGYVDMDQTGEQLGLRYSEFIAPMAKAIQELSARLEAAETKLAALTPAVRSRA